MPRARGFFTSRVIDYQGPKQVEKYNLVDVGGKPFHALAVAFIDSLQNKPRANDSLLKKVLERFYQYYPKYMISQTYLTLSERMGILIHNPRKLELVECMAYVLRQFAVDELYAHPLKYRKAFIGLNAETPKNYLRDPKIELSQCAFDALAQALGIKIILSYKELGRELRKRETYAGIDQEVFNTIALVIQVQGGRYFPAVKNAAEVAYASQLTVSTPRPVENINTQEGTLSAILSLIAEDNKQLLQSYEQWRHTILSMAAAGELTCNQLLDLYITFLPDQSPSPFSLIDLAQSARKEPIAGTPVGAEQQTLVQLANSLANWISTAQVKADQLFDQIENQSVSARLR